MHSPDNNPDFVTEEMWLVTDVSNNYWVEAGAYSGFGKQFAGTHNYFWAQNTSAGYDEHDQSAQAALGSSTPAIEILKAGGNAWNNSYYTTNGWVFMGASTGNPNSGNDSVFFGTEYTSDDVTDFRDDGNINTIQWENGSGGWNNVFGQETKADTGPGHFLSSSWNSTSS